MNLPIKRRKTKYTALAIEIGVHRLFEDEEVVEIIKNQLKHYFLSYFLEKEFYLADQVKLFFKNGDEQLFNIFKFHIEKKQLKREGKIKWLGTQKELAELMLELFNKEWIEGLESGNVKKFSSLMADCFDIPKTQKRKDAKLHNSLYQLLKPQKSKITRYQGTYPQIYTPQYQVRFNSIKKNK